MTRYGSRTLSLSPDERDLVAWALGPMVDFFEEFDNKPRLPTLDGNVLQFGDDVTTADLIYRLGAQLEEMDGTAAEVRVARVLCRRIAAETGITEALVSELREGLSEEYDRRMWSN